MDSNSLKERVNINAWGEFECFNINTGFRESAIKGAGRGRYLKEKALQGYTLRKSKIYFDCYAPNENCVIALKDIKSFEKYLNFPDFIGRPSNITQINNFACTPFNIISGISSQYVYWWQPVCYFNHASGSNTNVYIDMTSENGELYFEMKALRDIEQGEELFIDYRNFKLPNWFKDHFSSLNMTSTENFGTTHSGNHIDDPYTIQKYLEHHTDYKIFIDNFYKTHKKNGNDFTITSFMNRLPKGGRVLDMGCCTGWHSYMFHEAGFEVTAVDSSEKYIAELDLTINPKVGCFETLNYVNIFDGFILSWMLHHLHRSGIQEALEKTFLSLKEGGWLYISTVEASENYRDNIGRLYTAFTEKELIRLLSDCGFNICHIEKYNLNHFENTSMLGIVIHAQRKAN